MLGFTVVLSVVIATSTHSYYAPAHSKNVGRAITHSWRVDSLTSTFWTCLFPVEGIFGYFLLSPACLIEIPVPNANSIDTDQTPRAASSDLGLHCLPMSLLWDARPKWIKFYPYRSMCAC